MASVVINLPKWLGSLSTCQYLTTFSSMHIPDRKDDRKTLFDDSDSSFMIFFIMFLKSALEIEALCINFGYYAGNGRHLKPCSDKN